MASRLARRATSTPRFRRSSPLVGKLQSQLSAARSRARNAGGTRVGSDLATAIGAAGLGITEEMGLIPRRIGSIDSAFLIGGVGALVIGPNIRGKIGKIVHDVSLGMLCVSAYRLGTGEKVLGGEDAGSGGWVDD